MTQANPTICAVSTPPGMGGIAVIRLSGPEALAIAERIWMGKPLSSAQSHTAHLGTVLDISAAKDSESPYPLDQAVATVFRGPNSFTGEDVVEFSVHGSTYVQRQLVNSLISAGARLAEPGEFTRRAFLSGRLDLTQAEAVADIIAAESRAAHRIANSQMRGAFSRRLVQLREQMIELASLLELELDFSEEDVEFASRQQLLSISQQAKSEIDRLAASFNSGSAIKNGIPVAIVGATNAGKSSILNALLDDDRAIVSDIHGTTRDIVEDVLRLGDYTLRIMDTAGLRDTNDTIESMGIERSRQAAAKAHIILNVVDITNPLAIDLPDTQATVINVYNKIDIGHANAPTQGAIACTDTPCQDVYVSAKTGAGIETLRQAIIDAARATDAGDAGEVLITNARHYHSLCQASESLGRAIDAQQAGLSGDLIAMDLRLAIDDLSSILGQITSQDILSSIFSRFCIGK